ncbi:NAD(P)H-dependent flavin oxidoreductase [Lachnoclostridium sp.]|uniref:NAD(P)H-dependent flavin oxidoreductase n=1 Tax=Lachnoclostridium sp. TaxID=2028282 RepID=UPI00289F0585|nr:nitronate monooxygenase family protein [Lachnoclostridium sp.]
MELKPLIIGNLKSRFPIIQGGMGVGISLSRLAGNVAKEGGIGIISTAQIGFEEEDFYTNPVNANLRAIEKHLIKAKEISENGIVGVNIMVASQNYKEYVICAAKSGADVIISGAGLPISLPEYVEGFNTKIAPIVSSVKAANVLLKMWDRKYHRTADFLVIEGPKAGGHLGFSLEELEGFESWNYEEEIKKIIDCKKDYEEKYQVKIPVIVAGGVFDHNDILHCLSLGADGVQIASRFVVTEECDASQAYKNEYLNAEKEDIEIVISPVGMPGRAIHNKFLEKIKTERERIDRCLRCIVTCNPSNTPYCITKALINAVKGNIDNALLFCGSEVYRLKEMTTVKKLMNELVMG